MWVKCQDGTLVNTNRFDIIAVVPTGKEQTTKLVAVKTTDPETREYEETICSCFTKKEAEQLRDDIFEALEKGDRIYSVLAEDH